MVVSNINYRNLTIFLVALVFLLSVASVSANDNITDGGIDDGDVQCDLSDIEIEKTDTKIQSDNLDMYYKDSSKLIAYVTDDNDNALENKSVNIEINGKTYNKVSDSNGRVDLDINLYAKTYNASIRFDGDDIYAENSFNTTVNVKKLPVSIESDDFETYLDSDLFFNVKIINQINNSPLENVKVLFRVYSDSNDYEDYTSLSDKNGVATLDRNLNVGSYNVHTSLKDKSYDANITESTLKVKETAETGCCSFYVQVSNTEGVAGFRRDSTYAADLYLKVSSWHGRTAIKQYKTAHTYFFHSITTSDGWMMGTGGADNPSINKAIENLAGKMVESGQIKKSYLKKIQKYEKSLGIGHFAIKAPNGDYAVVWKNGIKTGKLKAGEYMSVPNSPYYFRHGDYTKFNSNPAKAALKIGATDVFGVNRRDITIYHWKSATNNNYKTTSKVTVYASNDNGQLMGRYTPHLKDNIHFKGKFISKNKLPKTPNMKKLGTHSFGNIDKLIKTPTTINAPSVTNEFNTTKYFKITIKNKKTKKTISGVKIKVKLSSNNFTKTLTLKTDKNGVVKIDTKDLMVGSYKVTITPANNKYLISSTSSIVIKEE